MKLLTDEELKGNLHSILDEYFTDGEGWDGNGRDEILKLIESQKKAYAEYVIGEDEDDRYWDDKGKWEADLPPIVQDYDDAVDKESRNALRAEQRERNN